MSDREHTSDDPRRPTLADIRHWPAAVSVEDAGAAFGVSRSHSYELIKRGQFPAKVITLGASKRVLTEDLIRVLTGNHAPESRPTN